MRKSNWNISQNRTIQCTARLAPSVGTEEIAKEQLERLEVIQPDQRHPLHRGRNRRNCERAIGTKPPGRFKTWKLLIPVGTEEIAKEQLEPQCDAAEAAPCISSRNRRNCERAIGTHQDGTPFFIITVLPYVGTEEIAKEQLEQDRRIVTEKEAVADVGTEEIAKEQLEPSEQ